MLYVPSSYNNKPLPLIIMLHGCTQSPDDFAAGTRMNELAEEYGFLVAYPGQPSSANSSRCWNWFSAGDQLRDRGEPSLIAGITQQIMRDFRVETRKCLRGGPICRWCSGSDHGLGVPGSLRRYRHSLGPCLWGG